MQEVQARFDQLRQQLQRETDETRQRLNRSADERAAGEKAKFISTLLPVMDNLNRAIDAADMDRRASRSDSRWHSQYCQQLSIRVGECWS